MACAYSGRRILLGQITDADVSAAHGWREDQSLPMLRSAPFHPAWPCGWIFVDQMVCPVFIHGSTSHTVITAVEVDTLGHWLRIGEPRLVPGGGFDLYTQRPVPRFSFLCPAAPTSDTDVRYPITHAARTRTHEAIHAQSIDRIVGEDRRSFRQITKLRERSYETLRPKLDDRSDRLVTRTLVHQLIGAALSGFTMACAYWGRRMLLGESRRRRPRSSRGQSERSVLADAAVCRSILRGRAARSCSDQMVCPVLIMAPPPIL